MWEYIQEQVQAKFNGPSIKYILREANLLELEDKLTNLEEVVQFTNYFRSIRNLHEFVVASELGDFEPVINNFKSMKVLDNPAINVIIYYYINKCPYKPLCHFVTGTQAQYWLKVGFKPDCYKYM